jgi:16S rRNA (adenine1518-N6/adenine1519-N6)-dimethyltransferase
MKPLKRFGQNYLTDKNILQKIADEINPKFEDTIIEVGPGLGALTELIYPKVQKLTAVEIDKRVIENLQMKFPDLNLISKDFLVVNLEQLLNLDTKIRTSAFRIVGNIPYNLTSPIIFKLIEARKFISDAVFMVQYEVAKRMTALPRTKDYGIFSVLISAFSNIELCFKVSPNVFYPKPKVFSAVVHLYFNETENVITDDKLFIKVVKSCFSKRRKTLKNSLGSSIFANINFTGCKIDFSKRAEELLLNDFITLTNFIKESEIQIEA